MIFTNQTDIEFSHLNTRQLRDARFDFKGVESFLGEKNFTYYEQKKKKKKKSKKKKKQQLPTHLL